MSGRAVERLHAFLERAGRRRGNPVVEVAVDAARALLRGHDAAPSSLRHFDKNGEARVLQCLGPSLTTVFDVGANVGEWTNHALLAGAKHVHAFEISPATSDTLAARYANDARVTVNRVGLSSEPGTVTIRHFPDHPTLTTITDYPHDAPSTTIDVPVQTGDSYVAEHGIEHIDFMKLDVEGHEEQVIEGFRSTFEQGHVSVVQFEYGRVSILTKYLLRDFYEQMTGFGFEVGRIGANLVLFEDYDMSLETFADSNWIAVHSSRPDLKARLV